MLLNRLFRKNSYARTRHSLPDTRSAKGITPASNMYTGTLKSLVDVYLAGGFLIILFPLFLVCAGVIKIISGGPVLFKQVRCGRNGTPFTLYKFRTMHNGAASCQQDLITSNEADGPVFKIKNDPRIIPVAGKFLRKTGLDELPQLINVIRGEMSLIGPRPPLPEEVAQYTRWHLMRLTVKPGITGPWQVARKRNQIEFDDWVAMDIAYIENCNPMGDAKLLLKTIGAMSRGEGL